MPITGRRSAAGDIRSIEGGALLLGAGAILLLISLFLDWYAPGLEAWAIFEALDLLLATLAIGTLVAVAGRMGFGPPRPASWAFTFGAVALVIVVATLIDPPPVANAAGGETETGIWLAFAGAALMAIGAVLSVARISIALNVGEPAGSAPPPRASSRFAREPVDPVDEPPGTDPVRGRRSTVAPTAPEARPDAAGRRSTTPPTAPTRTL